METVRIFDKCPANPQHQHQHECMESEMRCAYCGLEIQRYNCHGCGRFLTAGELFEGARCEECI